ncbi:uncharacterized protein MELLADRAFT_103238 [Melampsora larici-populina 98AG31]|uniref:Uncharacterized protein n=1 Tax=Melampsora larici-populina (strain 98AG31 / pathotype 3-4-7) TaxID=747676 RepID=F4RB00_MELLP|nr:uncharacterized protein MELLADRAFT_103238 [Melampsora larici-populina 98AG31]EGG10563.1 hypothetical protein MELLADRAFT_103238 [Melampsora larici-populina 98AG31]
MTTSTCGQCQWMAKNPKSGTCQTPQCSGCERCYPFLRKSQCQLCKESNNVQHSEPPVRALLSNQIPGTLATPALTPISNTPSTASSLPQEFFQAGLLSQPELNNQPNSLAIQRLNSQVKFPVPYSSRSSELSNSQLQSSFRSSQSVRQTIGQTKGRKKKENKEDVEEESPEMEISITFTYLSGIGKSKTAANALMPQNPTSQKEPN